MELVRFEGCGVFSKGLSCYGHQKVVYKVWDMFGTELKVRRGGKKNRKWGRQGRRPGKKRYNHEMRWIKNKLRKLRQHLKQHPNDKIAVRALKYES